MSRVDLLARIGARVLSGSEFKRSRCSLVQKYAPPLAIASSAGFAHRHYVDPVLLGADSGVYDHSPVAPNGDFDSFRLWRSADPAGAELGSVSSVGSVRSQLLFGGGPAPIGREAFIEAAAKPEPLGVCGLRRGRVTSSRN